ncbi:MAG: hypothetical protein NTZ11_06670 [Gammaproteobacteria bacterium]|nr:hypothetical protein [Gammaproteobacteria bacterium]
MREPDSDPAGAAGDGFERIAPVTLNTAPATPSRRVDGGTVSTRTLLIGLGLIVLLALTLLVGLPAVIDTNGPATTAQANGADPVPNVAQQATASAAASEPAAAPAAAASSAPIWDDEALLRAREEAQTLATQLSQQLDGLRAKAVQRWAAAAFADAEAQIATAKAAFDAKDFRAAVDGYRAAATALAALDADSARQLDTARAAGFAALAAGSLDAAAAAFDLALAIAPNDALARRGQARVASFPAVQAQLQLAASAEARGDLAAASSAWRQALKLDPDTEAARTALGRLEGRAASARFEKTMAAALSALDAGRLDDAERELKAAASQRPGDAGIADARSRLDRARREQQLSAREAQAAAAVAAENWSAAIEHYEAVLALDPSLAAAQSGLAIARPRATLAARLAAWIAQPARLASESVHADASQGLAQARAIAAPGPVLQQQIGALDRLLRAAATAQDVSLQSDEKTEVTLYKVGPQGRFKDKRLQLKPGRYTAVGARPGYVDVRVEFEVRADAATAPVQIRCEDKL